MNDIFDALSEDYEALIRNARRCAYDLKHATDRIPDDDFLVDKLQNRARMWVTLFAKGNPGKDYRHRLLARIEDLEEFLVDAEKFFYNTETPIPPEIQKHFDRVSRAF